MPPEAGDCDGGDDLLAYKFFHMYGAVDSTCAPSQGIDYAAYDINDNDGSGANLTKQFCRACDWYGNCDYIRDETKFHLYKASRYVRVRCTALAY